MLAFRRPFNASTSARLRQMKDESNLVTPTWQNTGPHCMEEKHLLALVLGILLPSLCTRTGQSQPFHAVKDSILGLPFL